MRFHVGGIPESQDFVPGRMWKPLHEPSPWLMQFLAIPLGAMMFIGIGWAWYWLAAFEPSQLRSPSFLLAGLIVFIPLVVVHELIHAAVHPQFGKSSKTVLGFWPSKLLFFAHYDGELSRDRFITIMATPLAVLTILPLGIAVMIGYCHPLIAWVSTWNSFFACGDVFGIILLLFQVPRYAICRNQTWKTYWRLQSTSTIENHPPQMTCK